jgi:methyl-accepting chemotaxis protein
MRIRTVFLASAVAAAIPGVIAAGWLAVDDWSRWSSALSAAEATQVVSDADRAQTAFALETGGFNVALKTPSPDVGIIQRLSERTDGFLNAARLSAGRADFNAQAVTDTAAAMAKLRQDLLQAIAKPLADRDPGLGGELIQQRARLTARLSEFAAMAARRVMVDAPAIAAAVAVAAEVMDMREAIGRRSYMMNNWFATPTIPPAEIIIGDKLTGAGEQAWTSAQRMIDALDDAPLITAERARLLESFWRHDEPHSHILLEAARARAATPPGGTLPAWPEELATYRAWNTASLASIVVLRDAALDSAIATGQRMAAMAERKMLMAGGLAVVALALSVGSVILMLRRIVAPLQQITSAVERLAAGVLLSVIPGLKRSDEIGAMAKALQVLKDNASHAREQEREQVAARERRVIEDAEMRRAAEDSAALEAATLVVGSIGLALERLAAGDVTVRVETALPPAYEKLRGDLNTAMAQLQDMLRGIIGKTAALSSGTSEITRASDDLSRRTETQAASLEQTAAALDQITATVRKTAEGSKLARAVVGRTKADAEQSSEIVRKAVAAMGDIETASRQIGQIIGSIDDIAFQTNLLALNAGIEAARAGDSGRGFAVVASEVRALAQRSREAASEIKQLVSASAQQVEIGVRLVDETGQSLDRILTQVGEVNTAVAEIAASAQEQATALQEVNTAINQMDQVTQQNAAMVEQTTAAAHGLAQETADLVQLAERFQIGGDAGNAHKLRRPPPPAKLKLASNGRGTPGRQFAPAPAAETWTEF